MQPAIPATMPTTLPNPVVMVIVLGALSLAPFILIMITSFVKISVVLSILRNALGTQSVPPNQILTGLAFVLSIFIMTPVTREMYREAGNVPDTREVFSQASVKTLFDAVGRGREPLRHFLARHAHPEDRVLFIQLAQRLEDAETAEEARTTQIASNAGASGQTPATAAPQSAAVDKPRPAAPAVTRTVLGKDDFQVLIPAFVTSQLKEAFEVGFLVFIPFVIIDMVIANILLAMGMQMLSPSVISLPFKLLLFVLVDGWFLIIRGLVLSYV